MDQNYKNFHRDVRNLRFKLHDTLDDHRHAMAQSLKNDVQRLEDELEMGKKPRSLEDRIKGIQQVLKRVGDRGENLIMNVEHADFFHDRFEDMRMSLRRLPNY